MITLILLTLIILNLLNTFKLTSGGIHYVHKLWNPSLLLLGPLLFASYLQLSGKAVWRDFRNLLHLIPCLIKTLFLLNILLHSGGSDQIRDTLIVNYQNSYFLIILSLLIYSVYILIRVNSLKDINDLDAETLVLLISSVFIVISLVMTIMYPAKVIFHFNLGIDYRYFAYGLLLIVCIAIIRYWIISGITTNLNGVTQNQFSAALQKGYKKSTLSDSQVKQFKAEIIDYFEHSKAYLDPDLSPVQLSKALNISAHNLSQVFNIYFEKKFYNFVAEYRIKHAMIIMENDVYRLTIETIAYSCGFNSKTSFNHYFKITTGITPREYRTELEVKKKQV
ncbi:helix-turn-helix domain-containing protein [Pedobacter nototheniae]|uniref:helix-turn-helix domain-containing protein n=1 Tax=Pedobacter nototheniae TaxID=2488994 RepID=UPI00292FB86B|nr:helix-turn-helix domain-containing protein [Pedobacter nototheniae]